VAGRAAGTAIADRIIATALYALACAALWWRGRPRDDAATGDTAPILLVWSSQTGFARELAERSAEALRGAGVPVRVRGLHEVDAALLADSQRALFIASTTGEGDPPDHALPFLRGVMATPPRCSICSTACSRWATAAMATSADSATSWTSGCASTARIRCSMRSKSTTPIRRRCAIGSSCWDNSAAAPAELPDWSPAEYQPWTLLQREHLNPGSPGGPVYWVRLQPPPGVDVQWQAGDIAEIGPQHPRTARAWLDAQGFDADTVLDDGQTLLARVERSHLPSLVPRVICPHCWQPCSRCRIASTRSPR
jgi:sulfite reductase (NADPH) flavoprotein alpha-component